jgi:polyhydroxyalkanoate synthesis regulator phasin
MAFTRFKKLFTGKEDKFDDKDDLSKETKILPNTDDPESPEFSINQLNWGVDFELKFKTIADLISIYRRSTVNFEIEDAIEEITNEAIVKEPNDVVDIDLDGTDLKKGMQKKVKTEFDEIIKMLNFNNEADSYFRKWYIDGRVYFQNVVDPKKENEGIKKLQMLSPYDVVRVKITEPLKEFAKEKGVDLKGEYAFIYKINERRLDGCADAQFLHKYKHDKDEGYLISENLITYVPSGVTDPTGKYYISSLHKAMKPLNQLRLLEDSAVIYRITRAPERRVFFIDVGKLPKKKADAYVKKLIRNFKTKIYYDAATGEMSSKRNVMSMIQDYYLPTNADQKGTKIETLEGGQQLGEIEDIVYFKKKLYKSLKVPVARIDQDENPTVELGRSGELTRQELKFTKFVNFLRYRFSFLFMDVLGKQLVYKNIMNRKDFNKIKQDIRFVWQADNYFDELKTNDIWKERLETAEQFESFIGKFFSELWLQKEIFHMTDDDIAEQQKQIQKEESEDGGFGGEAEDDDFGDPGKDGSEPEPKPKEDDEPEPKDEPEPEPKPKDEK